MGVQRTRGDDPTGSYVHVSYPWAAAFTGASPAPRRYYATLIRQALRFGMPARRYGSFGARVARALAATGAPAQVVRLFPKRPRADIDSLLAAIARAWDTLVPGARWLPDAPPQLSALLLERSSARTCFVFGEEDHPLLVSKQARDEAGPLDVERSALEEAAGIDVAPRFLGVIDGSYVQEGIPGAPLPVEAVTPTGAAAMKWSVEHEALSSALSSLAAATRRSGPPQELTPDVQAALDTRELSASVRRTASGALDDLADLDVAVLRHGDTSAQNCLFVEDRLIALVDWEIARPRGAPGFDLLNAAVALLDQGVGLSRWSEERAWESFRSAWLRSEFLARARSDAHKSAVGAGASSEQADKLEVAFFARRLASRLARPGGYATGPQTAIKMLELACGH